MTFGTLAADQTLQSLDQGNERLALALEGEQNCFIASLLPLPYHSVAEASWPG